MEPGSRPRGGKTPDETCSQAVEQGTLMPDFGAMEEQANAMAHYLEALANRNTSEP